MSTETDFKNLLAHVTGGKEDVDREGLAETPARFVKAWRERLSGYTIDIPSILKSFKDGTCDEMVVEHNIPVISMCEHHCADIIGIAHVGYVPNGRIVGLSKLVRIVEAFASRLQVQERLTQQIAEALMADPLQAKGAGVIIRASHHCMLTRGVRAHGTSTTTSAMKGVFMDDARARSEFISLCALAERSSGI